MGVITEVFVGKSGWFERVFRYANISYFFEAHILFLESRTDRLSKDKAYFFLDKN